jgi:xylulokinase
MFAVINLGMKSIRLCLLDAHGGIQYKKGFSLTSVIFGDRVEQDGQEWWNLIETLFREAEMMGHSLSNIEAVTVSASSSCLVSVHSNGKPLRPIIMVNDHRHHEDEINSPTPVMLQRIHWIKQHEPEIFNATAYFLAPNDYIIYRLCGLAVTDTLNAEKSGYDLTTQRYLTKDENVLAKLPAVREVSEVVGHLRAEVASRLHLRPTVQVVLSSYDAIVSVIGSGVTEEGVLCDVSGTITSIRLQTREPKRHPAGAIISQPIPLLGCHYLGGSNNLGGGLIEWLKTTFYPSSSHVYDMIQADAQAVTPRDSRIILLPYLMGERAPIWNPDARGVFFGIERIHSRKHFARATLEASAFSGRTLIDAIIESYGKPPVKMRLSGGLSRLDICNRIKADIYGIPLEIVSEFESTVMGAYLLAFHRQLGLKPGSPGWLKNIVKVRDIVLPDEEASEIYREAFSTFKEIYQALQPVFLKNRRRISTPMKSEDGYLENL